MKRFIRYIILMVFAGVLFTASGCADNLFYGVGEREFPDTEGPIINFINPQDGQEASGVFKIVGTAVDENDVSMVWVGVDTSNTTEFVEATFTGRVFSLDIDTSLYSEGIHYISAYAQDISENLNQSKLYTVTLVVDREIPTISLSAPTNGHYFNGNFPVAGLAFDSNTISTVQFSYNAANWFSVDASTIIAGTNTFSSNMSVATLSNGFVNLYARAVDATGKYGQTVVTFNVDKIDPVLTLVAPTNDNTVPTTFNIYATASDNEYIRYMLLKIDNVVVKSNNNATNIFTTFVTNTSFEGPHVITAEVFDYAGNKAEQTINIVVNDNPAQVDSVTFTHPSVGTDEYLAGTTTINGTASDSGQVVNVLWKLATDTTWTTNLSGLSTTSTNFTISLDTTLETDGTNALLIRASDNLQGFSTFATNIYIDNTDPTITMINPAANGDTKGGLFNITVEFKDNIYLSDAAIYTNNGLLTNVSGLTANTLQKVISGIWDLSVFTDGSTQYVIAEATDYADHTIVVTNSIVVSNNIPSIVMSAPQQGDYVPANALVLGKAIRVPEGITNSEIKLTGGSFVVAATNSYDALRLTNTFSHTVDTTGVAEGPQTITVRAIASNGSYTEEPISVIVDYTYPSASFTSPTSGNKYYSDIVLSGTASDNFGIDTITLEVETNGQVIATIDPAVSSGTWATNWDSTTLPVGDVDFILTVVDLAGNTTVVTNSVVVAPYITGLSDSAVMLGGSLSVSAFNMGTGTVSVDFVGQSATGTGTASNMVTVTVPANAKSGWMKVSVNGVSSINSNWVNVWDITQAYSLTFGQAECAFDISDSDDVYFLQSWTKNTDGATNVIVSDWSGGYTQQHFAGSPTTGGEIMANASAIDVEGQIMATSYSPPKLTGVWVSVFTNSGSAWIHIGNEQVDASVTVSGGGATDIDIDSAGNIHLTYTDSSTGTIKYGYSSDLGQSWSLENVITGVSLDPVIADAQPAIETSSGNDPHIVYYDYGQTHLVHATKVGPAWNIQVVDNNGFNGLYADMVIDSSDNIHVSYYNGDDGDTMYAVYNGSTWTSEVVDYAAITGNYTGIDVYSDKIAISYQSSSYNNAWLSYYDGSVWRNIKVPDAGGSIALPYGINSGVRFTSTGEIWIGFVDNASVLWVAEYKK